MDHLASFLNKDWKTKLLDLFCIVVLNMTFGTSRIEVRIPGFVNIPPRQWVRAVRRARREDFSDMWGDTPESCHRQIDDIFDLRRLFGEEPYDIIIEEEENWEQEEWNIGEEEREKDVVENGELEIRNG
ncbi:hypothetical protein EAG_07267 [Camponotus floridanus]|uniref:Uncharacterized protein n=1 Tax=Camponotus floridanus TaxID=104421 RepID=E2AQS4_CAMFO|nr:hypothetical protein EAG_07267 [Camponotus floridanus]